MPTPRLHKDLHNDSDLMHEAKGFNEASENYSSRKSINSQSEWQRDKVLPNAISVVNGYDAPTTQLNKDIYVVSNIIISIQDYTFISGNTMRLSSMTNYDESLYSVNSYINVSVDEPNQSIRGTFLITALTSTTIDITVPNVTDSSEDRVGSASIGYIVHEDYDPNTNDIPANGQVRHFSGVDLWFGDPFEIGDCFYNISLSESQCWNGLSLGGSSITITANYTVLSTDTIIYLDSSGGAFTVTLESSPANDRKLKIIDKVGSCGTNTVTINGNGKNIVGESDALASINFIGYDIIYNGTQYNFN